MSRQSTPKNLSLAPPLFRKHSIVLATDQPSLIIFSLAMAKESDLVRASSFRDCGIPITKFVPSVYRRPREYAWSGTNVALRRSARGSMMGMIYRRGMGACYPAERQICHRNPLNRVSETLSSKPARFIGTAIQLQGFFRG